jgi:hypothetical protein
VRAADPAFAITGVSAPTGLHYSWSWPLGPACKVHFVHMNLFPGHACGSPANPGKEGPTFPCADGWTWPEDSLGFLKQDLAKNADSHTLVVTMQHYGFDGWSRTWFNEDQAVEMWSILSAYKTLAVLVGHTHGASVYSFNGTADVGQFDPTNEAPGFVSVINAPATQKEDGDHNPLPSEFMVLEAALDAAGAGTFRVAQRVGSAWGSVQGTKAFTC